MKNSTSRIPYLIIVALLVGFSYYFIPDFCPGPIDDAIAHLVTVILGVFAQALVSGITAKTAATLPSSDPID